MAMAQVTSSDHKGFPSVSAYLRNPAHLVSSASVPTDFTSPKYLMDAPADCPVSWPMPDQFLPSEIKLQQGTSFPSDNPHALSGPIPNTDWQQFIDPATVAYSSGLVPPGAVTSALMSNVAEVTKLANGSLSYTPSPGRPSPGVDRGSSTWATSNLTVDPSKGGLALQGSTSQCFAEFPSDPGFAERAARYSSMGYGQHSPNKLSRTSSMRGDNNATEEAVKSALDEGKLFSKLHKVSQEAGRSPSKEDSLSSAHNSMEQGNRKRKSNEDKCKDVATRKTESEDTKLKRQKASEGSKEEGKAKTEKSSSENSGSTSPKSAKENPKPPEPPKQDYIHVRARRGQATDSHSLAERVRREKISERMKFLQDLVPGCSKVTGKAVMLDEIINYVQSLQRQVEFLSMKLAAVNPRLDINLDGLLTKEILQSRAAGSPVVLNHDAGSNYLHIPQLQHAQQGVMQLGTCGLDLRSLSSVENTGFGDSGSQTSTVWDGELQSVVQMSFGALSQELQGHLPAGHMKVEI